MFMFKVPCGGFNLSEDIFSTNGNNELILTNGIREVELVDGIFNVWEYEQGLYHILNKKANVLNFKCKVGTGENIELKTARLVMNNSDYIAMFIYTDTRGRIIITCSFLINGFKITQTYDPKTDTWTAEHDKGIDGCLKQPASYYGHVGQFLSMDENNLPVWSDLIIPSSTSGSSKKFKIVIDDSGTISAVEVTA